MPFPEKKYIDGMKLKDSNKNKKIMVTAEVIGEAIGMFYFIKRNN